MKKRRQRIIIFTVLLYSFFINLGYTETLYWEKPVTVSSRDGRFLTTASKGSVSAVVWQEVVKTTSNSGMFFLSTAIHDGKDWRVHERISDAIPYAGEIPSVSSVVVGKNSQIIITAITGHQEITFFVSNDAGTTFKVHKKPVPLVNIVSPYITCRADGGYYLFISQGIDEQFLLFFASSSDGVHWSNFAPFISRTVSPRVFLPTHAVINNTDVVVFQAYHQNEGIANYQLFSTVLLADKKAWSTPVMLTNSLKSHNQRPVLYTMDGKTGHLVWEYMPHERRQGSIRYVRINKEGHIVGLPEIVAAMHGTAHAPKVIQLETTLYIIWTLELDGEHRLSIAQKKIDTTSWENEEIDTGSGNSLVAYLLNINNHLEMIWENISQSYQIMRSTPDYTVSPPRLIPVGFNEKTASEKQKIAVHIRFPKDSSGIAGYSYVWEKDAPPTIIPKVLQNFSDKSVIRFDPNEDGKWYLGVRILDYAGNWSEPEILLYARDTTPPDVPINVQTCFEKNGFLKSNTFTVRWEPPEHDAAGNTEGAIKGYTWHLQYVDSFLGLERKVKRNHTDISTTQQLQEFCKIHYPVKKMPTMRKTKNPVVNFNNADNGVYAFQVSGIDAAGNIGLPQTIFFVLNKYKPYTSVSYVDGEKSVSGELHLTIIGKGFTTGGKITGVYLDRDGKPPYDYPLAKKNIAVIHDRRMKVTINDVPEGRYVIVLRHSKRGLYTVHQPIYVDEIGTVKFGNFETFSSPRWSIGSMGEKQNTIRLLFIIAFSVFTVVPIVLSLIGILISLREGIAARNDLHALFTGDLMPKEKKRKALEAKNRGVSLRFKLVAFTIVLIGSVIILLAAPLGLQFSKTQESLLVQSLKGRVEVLLDSLTSGAKAYLPEKNILELGVLPNQAASLAEATYVVITGPNITEDKEGNTFVWAASKNYISDHINTEKFLYGRSEYQFEDSNNIITRMENLNKEASSEIDLMAKDVAALTKEAMGLALKSDKASFLRLNEIQNIIKKMEEKIALSLSALSDKGIGSYPAYNTEKLSSTETHFVFYKPVMYRKIEMAGSYVHGIVFVGVSTEPLIAQMKSLTENLKRTITYIALLTLAIGGIGAWILASIIISPINTLAAHVAMIRDTEDKEKLSGKSIVLKSNDEIGMLGKTINGMTLGLVQAAAASKDLTVGKEIQKMFIPLETNTNGKKLTSGSKKDSYVEFFGYYEGARGVSGDYFDYIKLDDQYYAIIKCDVAGKGVPAALIMVEVATLFLNYFHEWTLEKNGIHISPLVARINSLIESRGFQGRFAAFTLCLFNSHSGDAYFCNAGDNIIHIYDAKQKKNRMITLQESSAAGVFPNELIDMKGGFKTEKIHLNAGDVLFLYTDGIEEAKRLFRSADLQPITCSESSAEKETVHENHTVGQDGEELGYDRVKEIIESVFARRTFTLKKWHSPPDQDSVEFDFTRCEGTLEEAVIALAAVERVFRMYLDSTATEFDRILVDKKIDLFLNKYFKQYGIYCANRESVPEQDEYIFYTHIKEDEQYDDLTLLSVKKL